MGENNIKYMFLGQNFRSACAILIYDTTTLLWRPTAMLRVRSGETLEGW